jgi:uncharacterized iron-regulated membrane protein
MSRRSGYWDEPRRTLLRVCLFQVHLYLGLILGLVWTVTGITGSMIVFYREMRRMQAPAGNTLQVPRTEVRPPKASLDRTAIARSVY